MRDAFVERLMELAAADPRIMLLTGDLGFGVLVDPTPDGTKPRYAERFPRQYLNVGVAEQNMTGIATGLAMEGRIVFTYSIANFPTLRCLEQVRNDAAYHGANVKVVAIGGGFSYGALGISHHATEDLSIMRSLPDVTVVSPGDVWETQEATSALVETPGTCYLRLDKSVAPPTHADGERFELGRARLIRDGHDLTLIATGGILGEALVAAEDLAMRGIECRVLSMHTIKPFDAEAVVSAARETGGIITIEEHTIHGGLGSAVAEACLDAAALPGAFSRIGLRAGFSSVVGSQQYLRSVYRMDAPAIVRQAETLLGRAT
jgi:transketolase